MNGADLPAHRPWQKTSPPRGCLSPLSRRPCPRPTLRMVQAGAPGDMFKRIAPPDEMIRRGLGRSQGWKPFFQREGRTIALNQWFAVRITAASTPHRPATRKSHPPIAEGLSTRESLRAHQPWRPVTIETPRTRHAKLDIPRSRGACQYAPANRVVTLNEHESFLVKGCFLVWVVLG